MISPHSLCTETLQAATIEKKATLDVLRSLRQVDSQKAYLQLGYSSLFAFCVSYLKYSESAAQRRIQACRLIKELGSERSSCVRRIEEKIKSGSLNLSQLATPQRVFQHQKYALKKNPNQKEKLEVLSRFEGQAHRQCEKEAARITGVQVPSRDTWQNGAGEELRLSVTIDTKTRDLLQRFKEITAHQNPTASTAEAIKLALRIAISQKDPALNPPKRIKNQTTAGKELKKQNDHLRITREYICKSSQYKLFAEKKEGCAWVDPVTKRRCGSKFKLQVDHIRPVSRGGTSEFKNLQLLCASHNQFKSNKL